MSTVFDNIITSTWPGHFVWVDNVCVTFTTIEPTLPGRVLMVPRAAYGAWTDAPSDVIAHLMTMAHTIGLAQKAVFGVPRIDLAIMGFEVPHIHLHVIPLHGETDILLSKVTPASGEGPGGAITTLRETSLFAGRGRHVPPSMKSAALA